MSIPIIKETQPTAQALAILHLIRNCGYSSLLSCGIVLITIDGSSLTLFIARKRWRGFIIIVAGDGVNVKDSVISKKEKGKHTKWHDEEINRADLQQTIFKITNQRYDHKTIQQEG